MGEPTSSVEPSDRFIVDRSGDDFRFGFPPFQVEDDPDGGSGWSVVFEEGTEQAGVMPLRVDGYESVSQGSLGHT